MTTNVFSTFISLTDVRSFYSTALAYVFDKLPLQKEELEMAEVMDVKKRISSKFSQIRFWLARFPCLSRSLDIEKLEKEFSKYQVSIESFKSNLGLSCIVCPLPNS